METIDLIPEPPWYCCTKEKVANRNGLIEKFTNIFIHWIINLESVSDLSVMNHN